MKYFKFLIFFLLISLPLYAGNLTFITDLNFANISDAQSLMVRKVGVYNLDIIRTTTTNAGDTFKLQCGGAACSESNPGFVVMPSTSTPGESVQFTIPYDDVTLLLSGAHWGLGGTGNLTGGLIRALFVNDNGTLKICAAYLGGRDTLLTTDTSITPTNINLPEEVLCDLAVTSSSNTVLDFGYVRANFNDTGDLWAIQTGPNDVVTGKNADGLWQPWNLSLSGYASNPGGTALFNQIGRNIFYLVTSTSATSNATSLTHTAPAKAARTNAFSAISYYQDNSVEGTGGFSATTAGSSTIDCYKSGAANWTASNNKFIRYQGSYEVGPAASFIE